MQTRGILMDGLDQSVLLLSCIAEIYIFYDFLNNYFDTRKKIRENRLLFMAINAIAISGLFIVNCNENARLNIIIAPLLLWIFSLFIFNARFGERLFYFIVTFIVFFGCEFLFLVILNLTARDISYENIGGISLQMFIMKLLTYIILAVVKQISPNSKRRMAGKVFLIYLCVPVASLGILLGTFYSGADFSESFRLKIIMVICSSLMVAGNILLFYAFNRYSEELHNNIKQKVIIERQERDDKYYAQMIELNEKHDEFMHNATHFLKTIANFSAAGDYQGILNIVGELNEDIDRGRMLVYSGNAVLNAVLSEKRSAAEKMGVEFDAYVEPGVILKTVSDTDLIAMLANLLDNAVRAASDSENGKWVKVRIFMQELGGFCVIKVSNGFSGKLKTDGRKILSTKKEKGIHGIGIKSVENMAEKYGGYLDIRVEGDVFKAILLLSTDTV